MIVLRLIFTALKWAIWVADIALLVYVVLTYVKTENSTANRIRQSLALGCEPVLIPARQLLEKYLPSKYRILDWSPILVWLALGIARNLLELLERIVL